MDILDSEASEDEAARNEISLDRLPSHEANVELIEKERRYRRILADAADGDETIRRKWDEWEESVAQLMWDEVSLFLRLIYSFLIEYYTGRSGIISSFLYRRIVF
jgi:programmed cell death 6-interacting protein